MFIIIPESMFSEARAVGPFDHKEEAEAYARKNIKRIWRVLPMDKPKEPEPA